MQTLHILNYIINPPIYQAPNGTSSPVCFRTYLILKKLVSPCDVTAVQIVPRVLAINKRRYTYDENHFAPLILISWINWVLLYFRLSHIFLS